MAVLAIDLTLPRATGLATPAYAPWTALSHWLQAITDKVQGFGGVLLQRSPPLMTAAFGLPQSLEQMPHRAVQAALTIRRLAAEEAMRQEGFPDFHITERNADGQLVRASHRPEYAVVSYIEPYAGTERALGLDVASVPDRNNALQQARDTGGPRAIGRLTLVQGSDGQFGDCSSCPSMPWERRARVARPHLGVVHRGL